MCTSLRAQDAAGPPSAGTLRAIRIGTGNVFAPAELGDRFAPRVINGVHWTTRTDVIWRELWFVPGDRVDAAMAAELERNLRALGLFAEVTVTLVPTEVPGEVDLAIATRDRLSLFFGGGGTYVGGVAGVNFAAGEGNLFGSGDRLFGSFRQNSDGDSRGTIGYTDLHLFDSWATASLRLNRTDVGDGVAAEVERPFKHLDDPLRWRVAALHDEREVDYYRGGEVEGSVPWRTGSVAGSFAWGDGPRDARRTVGWSAVVDSDQFGAARGALAPDLRVPGDTTTLRLGGTMTFDDIDGYREVRGMDTLGYVQDLTLGRRLSLFAGGRWRQEDGRDSELQPEFALGAGWSAEPIDDVLTHLGLGTAARYRAGAPAGWSAAARAQAFWRQGAACTAAASGTFDAVEEQQALPAELTLGEDNGLRGYDARLLAGTRRLRLNVEQRCDTGVEFWTLHLGAVAFADAGWVGAGRDLGAPVRSAGLGLRIGSPSLLGSGILRIDVAHALDTLPGNGSDWSVSASLGQVFTFGGNGSSLDAR